VNAEVQCSQTLLLQADFDGELDAAQSAALEVHTVSCSLCAQTLLQLQRSRTLFRGAQRFSASQSMREAMSKQLRAADSASASRSSAHSEKPSRFRYSLFGAGAGAIAAGVLTFVLLGVSAQQSVDLFVDNHIRAMQSSAHLLDVVSSEHHTVKPWFAGQIDFAPPVKDLEAFGYPLRGGRVDVIAGRNVAVLIYQAGRHTIDVTVEPFAGAKSGPDSKTLRGFNVRHWSDQDFSLWAVTDMNGRELDAFVDHWKAAR
jgi:anti-sigma factor RsiW